jgi:hypothetical protein
MRVAEARNVDPRVGQPAAASKRRYEAPRLVAETMDVRGTDKTNSSVIDQHNSTIGSGS